MKLLKILAVPIIALAALIAPTTAHAYPYNCSTGHTSGSVWIFCDGAWYQAYGRFSNPYTGATVYRSGPIKGNGATSIAWGPGSPWVLVSYGYLKG